MGLFSDTSPPSLAAQFDPPFEVLGARKNSSAVIFNSPHSGNIYPKHFIESLKVSVHTFRRSEDALIDVLFKPVAEFGAPLVNISSVTPSILG